MILLLLRHGASRSPYQHSPVFRQCAWTRNLSSWRFPPLILKSNQTPHGTLQSTSQLGGNQEFRNKAFANGIDREAVIRQDGLGYSDTDEHVPAGEPSRAPWNTPSPQDAVLEALRAEDSHALLRSLIVAVQQDPDFCQSLPATTLREILHAIKPDKYLDPYKAAVRASHFANLSSVRKEIPSLPKVFSNFAKTIDALVDRLHGPGHAFGLQEYKLLLDVGRATGDEARAVKWFRLMCERGVQPDTSCYNYLFEAMCWNNAHVPVEYRQLRVTPRSLNIRSKPLDTRYPQYRGYSVGERGLKAKIFSIFEEMISSGVLANTATYCFLMQAMGREGDLGGVKSILSRVWEIDVDKITSSQDDSVLFENSLNSDSPTYPDQYLLFTIAHAFGTNNQLPTAMWVVDHVSRRFSVEIDFETWSQLAEWTFVLSRPRHGTTGEKLRRKHNQSIGKLPLTSMENLWMTMTSEPYHVKPTFPLYHMQIKMFWHRGRLDRYLETFREARKLSDEDFMQDASAVLTGSDNHRFTWTKTPQEPSAHPTTEQLLTSVSRARDTFMMQHWLKLLIGQSSWRYSPEYEGNQHITSDTDWRRRGIPNALAEFEDFRPKNGAAYNIESGRVQFHPAPDHEYSYARLTIVDQCDSGRVLLEVAEFNVRPYLGDSRTRRIQLRHEKLLRRSAEDGWTGRIKEPKLVPAWHEKADVRNWDPMAKRPTFQNQTYSYPLAPRWWTPHIGRQRRV